MRLAKQLICWPFFLLITTSAFSAECILKIKKGPFSRAQVSQFQADSQLDCNKKIVEKYVIERPFSSAKVTFNGKKYKISNSTAIKILIKKYSIDTSQRSYPFKHCELKQYRSHILANDGTFLLDDCAPDTLYSWGNLEKAKSWVAFQASNSDKVSVLPRVLWASRTPLSTYAYGDVLLRIKLKKGTRIKFLDDPLERATRAAIIEDGNIQVSYFNRDNFYRKDKPSFVEYIIATNRDIESISYGQELSFKEILYEYLWIKYHSAEDYDLWGKWGTIDRLENYPFDGLVWTIRVLEERILNQLKLFLKKTKGFSGTEKDDFQIKQHFHTANPSYFSINQ